MKTINYILTSIFILLAIHAKAQKSVTTAMTQSIVIDERVLNSYIHDDFLCKDSVISVQHKFSDIFRKEEITQKEYLLISVIAKILNGIDTSYMIQLNSDEFDYLVMYYHNLVTSKENSIVVLK